MTDTRTRVRRVSVTERRCPVCRKWFAARRRDAVACSASCRARASYLRRKAAKPRDP